MDITTTLPVLKDSAGGADIVWGDDEIFHKIVVSKCESDSGVHETAGISSKATLMGNVGGHFTEGNHDKVTDESDKAVPKEKTKRAASRRRKIVLEPGKLREWRGLTGRELFRIQ